MKSLLVVVVTLAFVASARGIGLNDPADVVSALVRDSAKPLTDLVEKVGNLASDMMKPVNGLLLKLIDLSVKSLRFIIRVAADGSGKLRQQLMKFLDDLKLKKLLGDFVKNVNDTVQKVYKESPKELKDALTPVVKDITDVLTSVGDMLPKVLDGLKNTLA